MSMYRSSQINSVLCLCNRWILYSSTYSKMHCMPATSGFRTYHNLDAENKFVNINCTILGNLWELRLQSNLEVLSPSSGSLKNYTVSVNNNGYSNILLFWTQAWKLELVVSSCSVYPLIEHILFLNWNPSSEWFILSIESFFFCHSSPHPTLNI